MTIIRENYVAELNKYRDANLIKVLTGIRRSGKSTIFELYIDELKKTGITDAQIQLYNFESPFTLTKLGTTWQDIFFSIYETLEKEEMNYIFLDEIQQINEFEKLIDGLYVEKNINLFITGSNAYLLSSELATLLTGRDIEIHVLPYSFLEYKLAINDNKQDLELFMIDYFQESALPESVKLRQQGRDAVLRYVDSVYKSILEKDIYARIKNINRRTFENVFKYVLANIGSEISPSSIAKALRQDNLIIRHETVSDYLNKLCDSYLLYKVERFDIKGKQQLATLEKYYVPDLAIRYLLVGRKDFSDRGHLLENLVYLELLRRGGQIWVGRINRQEIDFVVKNNDGTLDYYQVTFSLQDEATYKRELLPLKAIKDSYPKTVITADLFEGDDEGVRIVNIVNWLTDKR
jgi:predicted AAA+ superfamily ATPase